MTREELKEAMPIITAFVEGKTIQMYDHNTGTWVDEREQLHTADLYLWPSDFRIKPEPKYRPFKNAEECWQEILKHQPFGWVKYQCDFFQIIHVDYNSIGYGSACGTLHSKFEDIFKDSTFVDGTPFGMKEE
nr:MAG: hypothetical protein [Bacteriophage sp.]